MMKKKGKIIVGAVLSIIVVGISYIGIENQFHSDYGQLDEADQYILDEINKYVEDTEEKDIWEDFDLGDKTLLALEDSFGSAYLRKFAAFLQRRSQCLLIIK